jgi:Uma2 family endonuclease
MSAEEFLAWDETQTQRHEFVRGELFVREGAHEAHVTVMGNLCIALRQHLRGSPCRTLAADMKLHVPAADAYFYPDVMVTCSEADRAQPLIKREPLLLVEVLSPSTAANDRGDKFAAYRLLPSLQEYVLIDPAKRRSEVFRKGADGLWVLHPVAQDQVLDLRSVALQIAPATLWAEVPE